VEPRRVALTLEAEADEHLVDIATHAGTTKSALAQWLIESVRLDERGIPIGWPETPNDEELPIDAA